VLETLLSFDFVVERDPHTLVDVADISSRYANNAGSNSTFGKDRRVRVEVHVVPCLGGAVFIWSRTGGLASREGHLPRAPSRIHGRAQL
jgi:hypothetical protein